jgi:hypothetical protein
MDEKAIRSEPKVSLSESKTSYGHSRNEKKKDRQPRKINRKGKNDPHNDKPTSVDNAREMERDAEYRYDSSYCTNISSTAMQETKRQTSRTGIQVE